MEGKSERSRQKIKVTYLVGRKSTFNDNVCSSASRPCPLLMFWERLKWDNCVLVTQVPHYDKF